MCSAHDTVEIYSHQDDAKSRGTRDLSRGRRGGREEQNRCGPAGWGRSGGAAVKRGWGGGFLRAISCPQVARCAQLVSRYSHLFDKRDIGLPTRCDCVNTAINIEPEASPEAGWFGA